MRESLIAELRKVAGWDQAELAGPASTGATSAPPRWRVPPKARPAFCDPCRAWARRRGGPSAPGQHLDRVAGSERRADIRIGPCLVSEQVVVLGLPSAPAAEGKRGCQVPGRTHAARLPARFSCREFSQKQGDVDARKGPIFP